MHLPHSSLSCLSCVDRHVEAIHERKGSTARALRICVSYHTKFNKWSRFAAPSPTCLGTPKWWTVLRRTINGLLLVSWRWERRLLPSDKQSSRCSGVTEPLIEPTAQLPRRHQERIGQRPVCASFQNAAKDSGKGPWCGSIGMQGAREQSDPQS